MFLESHEGGEILERSSGAHGGSDSEQRPDIIHGLVHGGLDNDKNKY